VSRRACHLRSGWRCRGGTSFSGTIRHPDTSSVIRSSTRDPHAANRPGSQALGVLLALGIVIGSPAVPVPGRAAAPTLAVSAPTSYSADIGWTLPAGAVMVELRRTGRLIDRFPADAGTAYVDRLLWPRSTYTYEVTAFAGDGSVLSDLSAEVTTPRQVGSFPRPYAEDSFWNRAIRRSPKIAKRSPAIVAASIAPYASVANLNDSQTWGIPLAYGGSTSEVYDVGCTRYGCDQDVRFPIPRYARSNLGSDGKLVVVDPATGTELDMGRAAYEPATDSWTTASRYPTAYGGWGAMCGSGQHCDGVLMSGIDQFGGVVRPEEIRQGHIDHALALSVPYWRYGRFVCPAVRWGGGVDDPDAIPLGARVQLDPTIDVSAEPWPPYEKVIARALQAYGAVVTDAGSGSFEVRAETDLDRGYPAWSYVGVHAGVSSAQKLPDVPWDRMRVLKLRWC
jgi:hypothetical protein